MSTYLALTTPLPDHVEWFTREILPLAPPLTVIVPSLLRGPFRTIAQLDPLSTIDAPALTVKLARRRVVVLSPSACLTTTLSPFAGSAPQSQVAAADQLPFARDVQVAACAVWTTSTNRRNDRKRTKLTGMDDAPKAVCRFAPDTPAGNGPQSRKTRFKQHTAWEPHETTHCEGTARRTTIYAILRALCV